MQATAPPVLYAFHHSSLIFKHSCGWGRLAPSLVAGVCALSLNDLLFREQIAIMRSDAAIEAIERNEQNQLVSSLGAQIKASGYPHRVYRRPMNHHHILSGAYHGQSTKAQ
jgi:hypothetical protein